MIYAFIRSFIGGLGRALMDFYIDNSLVINTLVLCYGLLIFIANRNYWLALEKIILDLREGNQKFAGSQIKKLSAKEYDSLRWARIRERIWFPLISEPKKVTVKVVTIENLKKFFSMNQLNNLLEGVHRKKNDEKDHANDSQNHK